MADRMGERIRRARYREEQLMLGWKQLVKDVRMFASILYHDYKANRPRREGK